MLRRFILTLLFVLCGSTAYAQDVGLFFAVTCSTEITAPVANRTVCVQSGGTAGIYLYTGSWELVVVAEGVAPASPDFVVGTADGDLTAERVATDSSRVDVSLSAGQITWDIIANSITATHIDETTTYTWSGTQTFTGTVTTDELNFAEHDLPPNCDSGSFYIYADLSENVLKKCQNGTTTNVDTGGLSGLTTNTLPKAASASTLSDSTISDSGGTISFGVVSGSYHQFSFTTPTAVRTITVPDASGTMLLTGYKRSIWFGAGSLSTDGTQCAAPGEVTINSGPKLWTIICTDNDASTIYGSVRMPDSWDGGTVTFTHVYIQTAADTAVLNGDVACQARSNAEVPSSTWGTEVALDDAAVVGSNSNDMTTSAAATCAGTSVAGGDMLYFRYQLDATGTTTAVATLHHLGFNIEYTINAAGD